MFSFLEHFGRYISMLGQLFVRPENWRMYWKETVRQMTNIGVGSLVIVGVIIAFTGAVTAIQFAYQLKNAPFPSYLLGYIVREGMIVEFAPTLACLLLAGKVGSNIASELGTMRISEQIDALEVMGINSAAYLVGPKIVGALIIVPPLVTIAAFTGIYGGLLGSASYGIPIPIFEQGLFYSFKSFTVVICLTKAIVFGFIVTSVPCYQGYYVKGGALEIGKASTRAVVFSSILIIAFDYIIMLLLT